MKVSLWKSAPGSSRHRTGQSIRGKISGPIPIPNPVDDEFPVRIPGPATASTRAPDNNEPVTQLPPPPTPPQPYHQHSTSTTSLTQNHSRTTPVAQSGSAEVAHNNPGAANHSPPLSSRQGTSPGSSPATALARTSSQRGTNQPAQVRYSTFSASSQRTGDTSNKDVPQRKKSTIRGALSKLFGRRKKADSQGSVEVEGAGITSAQHRSDPSALNRAGKDSEPKRSASLPITEYDRALRSHSVGIEDITAIESTRNSLHADYNFTRRRAATTSSQLYAPPRMKDGELAGLSPRPASTHDRSSRMLRDVEDPNEIGRAITSDLIGFRRRSRSLSGLQDIEVSRSGDVRRRSDEIRYWRESYDPGLLSPLSSNPPDGDDPAVASADLPPEAASSGRPGSPPEPFNFGSLANMNELAGMKITFAANLETRIGSLEARMDRMERVVAQLCNTVPGFQPQAQLPSPPSHLPPEPSIYQTASHDNEGDATRYSNLASSVDSRSSIGEAPTFVGSLHPPVGGRQPTTERSASNSTVRGGQGVPTHSGEVNGVLTADHYATILALIETERSTRRALEVKVKKMSRTLHILAAQSGLPLEFDEPLTSRSLGGQSAFDDDSTEEEDDDDGDGEDSNPKSRRGSPKRQLANPQDSGIAGPSGDTDDENQSDTFATPREERTLGFGAFGEELRDDEGEGNGKKAARTLSLSQLTVNRGQHNKPQLV